MLSIKEIASDKSDISSTRWGFAASLRFAMAAVILAIVVFVVCHLIGKPLDNSFLGAVSVLIGVVVGFTSGCKITQGFEPHKEKKVEEPTVDISEGK